MTAGHSRQALTFDLFSPFVKEGRVDRRLPAVLGIAERDYQGHFGTVVDREENTRFDFYMNAASGEKIFFDVKLAETAFGTCADDEEHRKQLEHQYLGHLEDQVDRKWLEPNTFCAHYELLRKLSYLGRYSGSGIVFIFPKANDALTRASETIKQIVSKALAPRVAILYVEYLVEKILLATADDAPLHERFLRIRARYIGV